MTFLELHHLTAQDLDAVVALDQLCFGGLWTKSGYERELESPCSQIFVLKASLAAKNTKLLNRSSVTLTPHQSTKLPTALPLENSIVGLGCVWSILEEAHITILAVHPDYRHQGFGQLLLYALLRDAKRHQLEWATLEVKPSNQAALSLYHKFGFSEAGRRRRYYKDTGEDALILWRSGLQSSEFEETLTHCYQQIGLNLADKAWQLSEF